MECGRPLVCLIFSPLARDVAGLCAECEMGAEEEEGGCEKRGKKEGRANVMNACYARNAVNHAERPLALRCPHITLIML